MPWYKSSGDSDHSSSYDSEGCDSSSGDELLCARCHRRGHTLEACYARTTVTGEGLPPVSKRAKQHEVAVVASRPVVQHVQSSSSVPVAMPSSAGVYVLRGDGEIMFYVGKSGDIDKRLAQHRSGSDGAAVVPRHMGQFVRVPVVTQGSVDDLESWERNETLHLMKVHGIRRVRGWMFTSLRMSDEHHEMAFEQICEKNDLCRRCGRNSHFASNCYAKSMVWWAEA